MTFHQMLRSNLYGCCLLENTGNRFIDFDPCVSFAVSRVSWHFLKYTKSDFPCVETRFSPSSRHCASVLQTQVPKLCAGLDLSVFYILILGTYSKFAWKNNFLALGVCFLQPCSSAGRRFAASRSRLQNYRRIVSFPQQKSMKCVVNCIPLRICVRSRNIQPHLEKT